jgi:hypothetical protein
MEYPNANGTATHVNANTSATTDVYIQLPSSSGELALTSEIPESSPAPFVKLATDQVNSTGTTRVVISSDAALTLTSGRRYLITGQIQLGRQTGTVLNHNLFVYISPGNNWNNWFESPTLRFYGSSSGAPYTAVSVTGAGSGLVSGDLQTRTGWSITADGGANMQYARFNFEFIFDAAETTVLNWYGCQSSADAGNYSSFYLPQFVALDLGAV